MMSYLDKVLKKVWTKNEQLKISARGLGNYTQLFAHVRDAFYWLFVIIKLPTVSRIAQECQKYFKLI